MPARLRLSILLFLQPGQLALPEVLRLVLIQLDQPARLKALQQHLQHHIVQQQLLGLLILLLTQLRTLQVTRLLSVQTYQVKVEGLRILRVPHRTLLLGLLLVQLRLTQPEARLQLLTRVDQLQRLLTLRPLLQQV